MGHSEAVALLDQILAEEKAADEKLTAIAESGINQEAANGAHPSGAGDGDEDASAAKTSAKSAKRR
jgi:hypothetical protein